MSRAWEWPQLDGPLRGMRVLDLSQQLPGPYATVLLASLGASVVKVEPPQGDNSRRLDPAMFANANVGKNSIVVDLKTDIGREVIYAAVGEAHVVLEGFRPGVVTRLGVDHPTLAAINPRLIYCSISAYGQTGPLSSHPAHDISLQAIAGSVSADIATDRIGVPWVDLATGTTAALAITAAWHAGAAGYLDMSMLDSAIAWATIKPVAVAEPEPTYGTVLTADGAVVIALLEDPMWLRLCHVLGWQDWSEDPGFATYQQRRHLARRIRVRLDAALGAMTTAEILSCAQAHDLPIHRIGRDTAADGQIASRTVEGASSCIPIPAAWQTPLGDAPPLPTHT